MKHHLTFTVLAAALAASTASGQYVEAVVGIRDSFCVRHALASMVYDSVDNRVYVGSSDYHRSGGIVTIDGRTNRKTGVIGVGAVRLGYNPRHNKVYAAQDSLRVIDAATNSVIRTLPFVADMYAEPAFAYNRVNDKMYFAQQEPSPCIAVIDGATDSLLRTIPLVSYPWVLTYDPVRNRLYTINAVDIWCIDGASDSVLRVVDIGFLNGFVRSACYNSQEDKLYCGTDDGIAVVDCQLGRLTKLIDEHNCWDFAYCPDGNRVYCLQDAPGPILEVDCALDSVVREIHVGGDTWFNGISYSPASNRLYCAASPNYVLVMNCATDSFVTVLHRGWVSAEGWTGFCFNLVEGKVYSAQDEMATVAVIAESALAIETTVIMGDYYWPVQLSYVPQRDRVYCVDREVGAVSVVDAGPLRLLAVVPVGACPGPLEPAGASGDLYLADADGIAVMGEADTVVNRIPLPFGHNRSMRFLADVNKIYQVVSDSAIASISLGPDTIIRRIPLTPGIGRLEPDAVQHRVYVSCGGSGVLAIVDAQLDSVVYMMDLGSEMWALAFSPMQNRLYCHATEAGIIVIDPVSLRFVDTLAVPAGQGAMLWNPAGDKVYCLVGGDSLMVIDCAANRVTARLRLPAGPRLLQLSDATRNRLYCACRDSTVVVDCRTDNIVARLPVTSMGPMAWDPARSRLYLITSDTTVTVIRDSAVGIAEARLLTEDWCRPPTIVRGVLSLPRDVTEIHFGISDRVPRPALLDVTGREVLELLPGPNDVRHLAPGVYYVRPASCLERAASGVTKVVITR